MGIGRPKLYRRKFAIKPEVLNEWEADLPLYFERVKAKIDDPEIHAALDAILEFQLEAVGEIRRIRGRIQSAKSDNHVMRKLIQQKGIQDRGLDLRIDTRWRQRQS